MRRSSALKHRKVPPRSLTLLIKFKYYSELAPGYRWGTWPMVWAPAAASAEEAAALLDRCAADAAAWAAGRRLPRLAGDPDDVCAAEIYRAEWIRQKQSTPPALRKSCSASSWLMFMDHELRDD